MFQRITGDAKRKNVSVKSIFQLSKKGSWNSDKRDYCIQCVEQVEQAERPGDTMSTQAYRDKFAKETTGPHNVKMTMIGGWSDVCAYYAGSDGNAWAYSMGWSNKGELPVFIEQLQVGKWRGEYNPSKKE